MILYEEVLKGSLPVEVIIILLFYSVDFVVEQSLFDQYCSDANNHVIFSINHSLK